MDDRTAQRQDGGGVGGGSGPVQARLRLLRPGLAAVLGAGAVAVCISVIRPAPAASQRAANLPVALLPVAATSPTTSASTTPTPTTAATTPRTTAATTPTSASRSRTTYTTRQSPTTSYSRSTASTDTTTTAPASTTTTTVAPLGGPGLPAPPSTLPLTTKKQSGHVSPVFAELSGVGFFIALVLVAIQAVLTRRRGKGRSL
ncbi:MAG: hypothetical protein M3Y91_09765 [Actinomycetota bacterium]|nr:hypothetical protein [Actinomycetota bacterium]